jgi:hypothetical protein
MFIELTASLARATDSLVDAAEEHNELMPSGVKSAVKSSFRLLLLTGTGVVAVAQTTFVPSGTRSGPAEIVFPNGASVSEAQICVAGSSLQPVFQRPYSAEEVIEYARKTVNGLDTPRTSLKPMLYRDSEGRTRTDTMIAHAGKLEDRLPNFIEIIDSVGGYRYILDPRTKTGPRATWPIPTKSANRRTNANPKPSRRSSAIALQTISESLGAQDLEGLRAEGTLTMTMVPTGYVENEEPITTTTENWISPDLKIILLAKWSNSRYGDTTMRLADIAQVEPDPTLFQVSADYQIVEE